LAWQHFTNHGLKCAREVKPEVLRHDTTWKINLTYDRMPLFAESEIDGKELPGELSFLQK